MFISKPTFVNSECKYSNISPFLRTFADDFNKICEIENFEEPLGDERRHLLEQELRNDLHQFLLSMKESFNG
jgi:hypothetical protein